MLSLKVSKPRLKRTNDMLTLIVAALALYIMLAPFLPAGLFWWRHLTTPTVQAASAAHKPIPKTNELVIPSIYLTETIHGGTDTYTELKKGVWRLPTSSTPDHGSNTVIAGHRFYYTSTAVFYNLDKVKTGSPITLYWNGKEYDYRVTSTRVVEPTNVAIEQPTPQPTLTLYTCTPMWTSRYRLVVQAHLIGVVS